MRKRDREAIEEVRRLFNLTHVVEPPRFACFMADAHTCVQVRHHEAADPRY
jgi:hypothetical protein